MELPEIHVCFRIISKAASVKEIAESLSLKPDKTWSVGQTRKGTLIKEVNSGVEFCSVNRGKVTLNEELNKLLKRVMGAVSPSKKFPRDYKKQFSCVIYSSATPELYLDERVISGVAEHGASIDIDLYKFDREEKPARN
jgi:hypothetical protein